MTLYRFTWIGLFVNSVVLFLMLTSTIESFLPEAQAVPVSKGSTSSQVQASAMNQVLGRSEEEASQNGSESSNGGSSSSVDSDDSGNSICKVEKVNKLNHYCPHRRRKRK